MMLTNGAMCVMSTLSFVQSFYDNYNKKAVEMSLSTKKGPLICTKKGPLISKIFSSQ